MTGKVPFPGGTIREKARRHCEEAPLNPKRINPELSDEFVEVVAAMMDKDPTRPDSNHGRSRRAAQALGHRRGGAADGRIGGVDPSHFDPLESLPVPMSDLASSFLGDEPSGVSLSQISQRTDPLSAAADETLPDVEPPRRLLRPEPDFPLSIVLAVLLPIVLAAAVLVINVLLQALAVGGRGAAASKSWRATDHFSAGVAAGVFSAGGSSVAGSSAVG